MRTSTIYVAKITIAMLLIYSNLFAAPTSATDANKTKEIV